MGILKRSPIDELWAEKAFCKYRDFDMWDLDATSAVPVDDLEEGEEVPPPPPPPWLKGRRHCIKDCTVREDCLRRALRDSDYGTYGVVRGGIKFDDAQKRKKKTLCLICQLPVAPIAHNAEGEVVRGVCYVCKRYSPCLRNCGRMARRRPGVDRSYCTHCKNWNRGLG